MKTSSSLTTLIQSCDFIGEKPGLYIKKSKKYRTTLGGFLCILIYMTLLLALLYFSQDLVFLQYPSESMSTLFTNHPFPIGLVSDEKRKSVDFHLSVSKGSEDLGEEYFTIEAFQIVEVMCSEYRHINMREVKDLSDIYRIYRSNLSMSHIENMTYIKNSVIPDNNKLVLNDYKEAFDLCSSSDSQKIILKNRISLTQCKGFAYRNKSFCISDTNKRSDLEVYGNKYFSFNKYITFNFLKCASNCPNDNEEIWKSNDISLSLYYNKYVSDLKSYSNPIYSVPDSIQSYYLKDYQSIHYIILKNIYINTDIGYILEDFQHELHIGIASLGFNLRQQSQSSQSSQSKIEITVQNSNTVEVIYRKYIKVQRILAEVGGLFKTFLIISLFLNYFHNRASYYEYLFNELFCLDDLGKYFQYFDPSLRSKFGRYRDSIILRNTKSETLIKKADQNFFSSNMNNENKKGNSIFTISNLNHGQNQNGRPDLADKTREKLLFSTTKMSRTSEQNRNINIIYDYEKQDNEEEGKEVKSIEDEKKIEEIVNLMKMSSIQIENYKNETENDNEVNDEDEKTSKNKEKKSGFNEEIGLYINENMNNINQVDLNKERENKYNEPILNSIIKDYDNNQNLINNENKSSIVVNMESDQDQSISIRSNNKDNNKDKDNLNDIDNKPYTNLQMTDEEVEDAENFYINKLINDQKAKENFIKSKNKTFTLTAFELSKYICCGRNLKNERKRNILFGGLEMIKERMEEVNLMKKNLELDRFKNLMLKDEQLLLLDSLSKYMLDPERAKLVDINQCGYEKFIDAYAKIFKSNNCVDVTLSKWVRTKYQLKL
jgi:hypothetical protein